MSLNRNLFTPLIVTTLLCGSVLAQPPEREPFRRRPPEAGGPRPDGPPGPPPGGPGFMRALPIMAALDANRDGKISSDEIANASAALKTLDKNNDGELTFEELRPAPPRDGDFPPRRRPGGPEGDRPRPESLQPGRGRPDNPEANRPRPDRPEARQGRGPEFFSRMFDQRDENKDGKLSGDEIPEQMAGRLERIDTNGDKAITKDELQAAMNRFGAGAGPRRDGDRPGRPGGDRPRRPGGDRPERPQPEAE